MVQHELNRPSYAMGVDIGGTKILIIIKDTKGQIVFREKFDTSRDVLKIVEMIKRSLNEAGASNYEILGMGVGVPGCVDTKNGVVMELPSLKWKNLELKKLLEPHFNFPIYIKNDVNYSAIGERYLGNGQKYENMVYISIGTGVGGALILNGSLVEGHNYSAGELGYFIDREDIRQGRKNVPQDFGVFEKKTSGKGLSEKAAEYGITSRQLFEEYAKGNEIVYPIIEDFVLNMSVAISNIVSLINPEIVIIGGGVSESMGCVIDKIRENVSSFTLIPVKIELSKIGGDAGALGAVQYVFNNV